MAIFKHLILKLSSNNWFATAVWPPSLTFRNTLTLWLVPVLCWLCSLWPIEKRCKIASVGWFKALEYKTPNGQRLQEGKWRAGGGNVLPGCSGPAEQKHEEPFQSARRMFAPRLRPQMLQVLWCWSHRVIGFIPIQTAIKGLFVHLCADSGSYLKHLSKLKGLNINRSSFCGVLLLLFFHNKPWNPPPL